MHWYTEHLSYILSYLWVCFDLQFISMFILHWCQIVHLISKKDLSYSHTFVNLKVSSSTVVHRHFSVCLTSKWLCPSYIKNTVSVWHQSDCVLLTLMSVLYIDVGKFVLHWWQCLILMSMCLFNIGVSVCLIFRTWKSVCLSKIDVNACHLCQCVCHILMLVCVLYIDVCLLLMSVCLSFINFSMSV